MGILPIPGFSEPVSCWSHLLSAFGFFVASFFLVRRGRGNSLRVTALIFYSCCVVYLFSMSGVYHLLEPEGVPRDVFKRLDHSAIWTMIAGTFTPIHIILFRGFWRWGILILIWTAAITGLVLEVIFIHEFPEILSLGFYVGLGWVGVLTTWKFVTHYQEHSVRFVVLGGVFYTVGAIFEFFRWPILWPGIIGSHEVFHFFVTLAALYHWRFILMIADIALKDKLTFLVKCRPGPHLFANARDEDIRIEARSRDDLYAKIGQSIQEKYRNHTRPKAIRIQFIEEDFIDTSGSDGPLDLVRDFHKQEYRGD